MNNKLLLFDIDGTLLTARGAPKTAMVNVLKKKYGTFDYDHHYNFAGRTDWEIIEHLLEHTRSAVSVTDNLIHELMHEFSLELEVELEQTMAPLVFAGVNKLLAKLESQEGVFLGLVTGNIEQGAKLKLKACGLDKFFPVGAYGNDARERWKLPPLAIRRANDFYGLEFDSKHTWIIGDSVHDITCARENNLRCLAVATGWTPREELENENPDYMVNDFAICDEILQILI